VRRDVFPEPLGPTRRIEGRVVRPLFLKTKVWRKIGIVKQRIIAIARGSGDGLRAYCTKSCNVVAFDIANQLIAPSIRSGRNVVFDRG